MAIDIFVLKHVDEAPFHTIDNPIDAFTLQLMLAFIREVGFNHGITHMPWWLDDMENNNLTTVLDSKGVNMVEQMGRVKPEVGGKENGLDHSYFNVANATLLPGMIC